MSITETHRRGLALAGMTAVISGFAVFVNGYGVRAWADAADATTYTTAKNLVAAVILVAAAGALAYRGSRERPRLPTRRGQRIGLIVIAAVGGAIPFVLFFEGLARAESAQAAFIHKTLIIWVAILAALTLGERIGIAHLGAIALLVAGQALLVGSAGEISFGVGEVMILAATLLWSVEVVVAKRLLHDLPASTVSIARMAGGAALLVAFVVIRGSSIDTAALGWEHMAWILVTGAVLAGYVGSWFLALARAPAVDVTAVLVAGAIITALLRAGVQGVPLAQPVGLVLLAAGVAVVLVARLRPRPAT